MKKKRSIFVLESITSKSDRYPKRKASCSPVAFYSTLERAEEALKRLIEQEEQYEDRYPRMDWDLYRIGYLISERAIDAFIHQPRDMVDDWVYNIRIRSYTPDGTFVCENSTPEVAPNYEFLGRKSEDVRFHHGDIVEAYMFGHAELCIVDHEPPSVERVAEIKENAKKQYPNDPDEWEWLGRLDYTDDSYLVYSIGEGDTHSHPLSYMLLPPPKPVTEKHERLLKDKLKEMDLLHNKEHGSNI